MIQGYRPLLWFLLTFPVYIVFCSAYVVFVSDDAPKSPLGALLKSIPTGGGLGQASASKIVAFIIDLHVLH